jgi:glutaredoxin
LIYTVIGRENCTFCDKATDMIEEKGYGYSYYGIDSDPWTKTLMLKAGYKTVPIIFDENGKEIGGYSDLKEHLDEI